MYVNVYADLLSSTAALESLQVRRGESGMEGQCRRWGLPDRALEPKQASEMLTPGYIRWLQSVSCLPLVTLCSHASNSQLDTFSRDRHLGASPLRHALDACILPLSVFHHVLLPRGIGQWHASSLGARSHGDPCEQSVVLQALFSTLSLF